MTRDEMRAYARDAVVNAPPMADDTKRAFRRALSNGPRQPDDTEGHITEAYGERSNRTHVRYHKAGVK